MAPLGTPVRLSRHRASIARTLRLVVMGDTHVGKTSIVHRYIHNKFLAKYTETIEELHTKHNAHTGNNNHIDIEILDTSGAMSFPDMRRVAIKAADVVMMVFSVDNEVSYNKCLDIREEIMDVRTDLPIIFVANKIDDVHLRVLDHEIMAVSVDIELDCKYVEVSAKTGQNIDDAFVTCMRNAN